MAAKLVFVRAISYNQLSCPDLALPASMRLDYTLVESRQYWVIEIGTVGWEQGARFRTKRLSVERAPAYANKLHAGGWIDDSTYNQMYFAVIHLCDSLDQLQSSDARYVLHEIACNAAVDMGLDGAVRMDMTTEVRK